MNSITVIDKENDYLNFTDFDEIAERMRTEHLIKTSVRQKHATAYITRNTQEYLTNCILQNNGRGPWTEEQKNDPNFLNPVCTEYWTQFGLIPFVIRYGSDDIWRYVGGEKDTDCCFLVREVEGKEPIVYLIKNIKRMERPKQVLEERKEIEGQYYEYHPSKARIKYGNKRGMPGLPENIKKEEERE